MTKLEETENLIESFEGCVLKATDGVLIDIAKSLAIIADKLCDVESEEGK